MNIPNYMSIKEVADYTIRRIVTDIEKDFTGEPMREYLEKYGCKNITELVYLFLCEAKPSDLNISLNMRQKIKNISNEVNESESEDEFLSSNIADLKNRQNDLINEIKSLSELLSFQTKKVEEIKQINAKLMLKLKSQAVATSDLGL